jgi:hypothetical protein
MVADTPHPAVRVPANGSSRETRTRPHRLRRLGDVSKRGQDEQSGMGSPLPGDRRLLGQVTAQRAASIPPKRSARSFPLVRFPRPGSGLPTSARVPTATGLCAGDPNDATGSTHQLRPDRRREAAKGQGQDDHHPISARPVALLRIRARASRRRLDLVVARRATGVARTGWSRPGNLARDRGRCRGRTCRRLGGRMCRRLGGRSGCRLVSRARGRHRRWRARIRRGRSRRRGDRHDGPLGRRCRGDGLAGRRG